MVYIEDDGDDRRKPTSLTQASARWGGCSILLLAHHSSTFQPAQSIQRAARDRRTQGVRAAEGLHKGQFRRDPVLTLMAALARSAPGRLCATVQRIGGPDGLYHPFSLQPGLGGDRCLFDDPLLALSRTLTLPSARARPDLSPGSPGPPFRKSLIVSQFCHFVLIFIIRGHRHQSKCQNLLYADHRQGFCTGMRL